MNLYPIEVNSDTSVTLESDSYIIDASANDVIMTLPDMTGMGWGKSIIFSRTDQSNFIVTIVATATTIDGAASVTIPAGGFRQIVYDDDDWHTIQGVGYSGFSGYSGMSGYSGYSGTSGYSGFSGISGYSGYSGFSGISGYSGFSGLSGYSGYSGNGVPAAGAAGTILRSNGSNWVASTDTYPDTIASGNILYATGSNVIDSSTELTYASGTLNITKSQNSGTYLLISNSTSGASAYSASFYTVNGGSSFVGIGNLSAGYSTSGILVANTGFVYSQVSGGLNIGTTTTTQLSFWTNNTERGRFLSTGEFLIGETSLGAAEIFGFQKNQNAGTYSYSTNTTSGASAYCGAFYNSNSGAQLGLGHLSSGWSTSGMLVAGTAFIYANTSNGINIGVSGAAGQIGFWSNGAEIARFTSVANLKIGGTASRGTTEGTNQVVIFNGTAPAGTLTNGASFFAAAGEMKVIDSAGNITLLSPHEKGTNYWIYDSIDTKTGKRLRIDMEKMMRAINEKFGWDFIHEFTMK